MTITAFEMLDNEEEKVARWAVSAEHSKTMSQADPRVIR
jgi:hypothetical protein